MSVPDPYARQVFRGRLLDNATIQRMKRVERELGREIPIVQGVGTASASAGTHEGRDGEGGRAVDLPATDHVKIVRIMRDLGFAAWYRPELPGVWGPHIHAVLIFEDRSNQRGIAPLAFDQIRKFDAGQDGLAGSDPDPNPYRPDPKRRYTLEAYRKSFAEPEPAPTNVSRARGAVEEALHSTWQATAWLKDAEGRPLAQAQIDDIQAARQELKAALEKLPQR